MLFRVINWKVLKEMYRCIIYRAVAVGSGVERAAAKVLKFEVKP